MSQQSASAKRHTSAKQSARKEGIQPEHIELPVLNHMVQTQ